MERIRTGADNREHLYHRAVVFIAADPSVPEMQHLGDLLGYRFEHL
jgi:hypothetical protein